MTDTYAIPAGQPVTVDTLRRLRLTFRSRNEPPPYYLALTRAQWRELESDIFLQNRYREIAFSRGFGFPRFMCEGIEVSRLTEVYPEPPRAEPALRPPASTHSTWPG